MITVDHLDFSEIIEMLNANPALRPVYSAPDSNGIVRIIGLEHDEAKEQHLSAVKTMEADRRARDKMHRESESRYNRHNYSRRRI